MTLIRQDQLREKEQFIKIIFALIIKDTIISIINTQKDYSF